MRQHWIINNSNKKLILFFNGWGMDENPFQHLISAEYEVLMFNNYQNFEADFSFTERYKDITLISWSMGVWAAGLVKDQIGNINHSIAINGTLYPINDDFGIPVSMFEATLKNFSLPNREKFYKRMFDSREDSARFLTVQPQRDVEDQRSELVSWQKMSQEISCNINYDSVIISKSDKIIPTKNQINFWNERTQATLIEAPHYPFYLWESWEDIIKYAAG